MRGLDHPQLGESPDNTAPYVAGDRLGVIVGHSLAVSSLFTDDAVALDRIEPETPWGSAVLFDHGDYVLLPRHGVDDFTPAHLLDHRANLAALCFAGCDRVVALASVGSLRGWPVGTIVCPFDFIAFHATDSYFDDAQGHSVPGFDEAWRDVVLDTWFEVTETDIMDGAVYAQTRGPRFETPAEVRLLGAHADIVGMTVASECVLAREAGLAYAAIATVDNLANGVSGAPLTVAEFHAGVEANQERLAADLGALLPALAAAPRPDQS